MVHSPSALKVGRGGSTSGFAVGVLAVGSMQDRGRAFGALGPREWPPHIDRFRIDL